MEQTVARRAVIMKSWKIIFMVALLLIPGLSGCGSGNTEQLAEVKDTAVAETEALKGTVIDAQEAAGEPGDTGDEPNEGIVKPPGEGGDDGGTILPPSPDERKPAKPIKGRIRMDDLVYPTRDMATGEPVKGKAASGSRHTQTTNDPFMEVWIYYSQVLKGRNQELDSNVGEEGVPYYASFVVRDGGNVFSIDLTERSKNGPTVIGITKS